LAAKLGCVPGVQVDRVRLAVYAELDGLVRWPASEVVL
jgi:hypothetical protein